MPASKATSSAPKAVSLNSDSSPSEVGSQIRPYRETRAGDELVVSAALTRDSTSG